MWRSRSTTRSPNSSCPRASPTVEGEQALAFVRTRKSFGNSGDLDRIKVQQQFLGSLMRKMASSDTLTSPSKLLNLAEAATKALTVDQAIGRVSTLKDVALELKKVPTKNISFTTVPVVDNPAETVKATVVVDKSKAPQVFDMIENDVSLTEVKQQEKKEKDAQSTPGSRAPSPRPPRCGCGSRTAVPSPAVRRRRSSTSRSRRA